MVKDDRLFTTRVALFARVGAVGVTEACRQFQVHRSTYYRWKASVERHGLEMLRPRARRLPRMPNQTQPWLEDPSSASRSATRAWVRGESQPSWHSRCGAR